MSHIGPWGETYAGSNLHQNNSNANQRAKSMTNLVLETSTKTYKINYTSGATGVEPVPPAFGAVVARAEDPGVAASQAPLVRPSVACWALAFYRSCSRYEGHKQDKNKTEKHKKLKAKTQNKKTNRGTMSLHHGTGVSTAKLDPKIFHEIPNQL